MLVTVMPRCTAVATSILSTPLPKLAISLSCSPDLLSTEASMRSVTVGTSTSAVFTASASSAWLIGLSSRIEAGVEQLAHARLDAVGQLARDDDQRLLTLGHLASLEHAAGTVPICGLQAPVQASLTRPADTAAYGTSAGPSRPSVSDGRAKTRRPGRGQPLGPAQASRPCGALAAAVPRDDEARIR